MLAFERVPYDEGHNGLGWVGYENPRRMSAMLSKLVL